MGLAAIWVSGSLYAPVPLLFRRDGFGELVRKHPISAQIARSPPGRHSFAANFVTILLTKLRPRAYSGLPSSSEPAAPLSPERTPHDSRHSPGEVTREPFVVPPTLAMSRAASASARATISPRSELVDEAYDRLRDWIITGRLAPGAPIIETDTATLLGVQRAHLRIALQKLQHTGFVVTSRIGTYSRTRVAPLTLDDVVELFTVVGAVEGLAARQAARMPSTRRSALVRSLKKTNRELLRLARREPSDYNSINDLDVEFHATYVKAAGGPRVLALHEAVKPQADRYERFYTNALIDQLEISVREHDAIIAAIESGDPDDAQHAVEINWRNAADRFARAVATSGERGSIP